MEAAQSIEERGPFFGAPLAEQEAECRAWLDANNRPDRHNAVRAHTVSPPQNGRFQILARVSVSKFWDDRSNIQCNLCNVSRKFVTRGYVASYDDGWWYVVGPDCGGEEFLGRFNTALHAHNRREAERLAEGDLQNLLNSLGAWQVFYSSLKGAVACVEEAVQTLESYEPELFGQLQDARRADGQVFTVKAVRATNHKGESYTRFDRDRFTTLAGTKAISRPCVPAAYFRRVIGDVQGFLTGENSLQEAITDHIESNELASLRERVEEALDNLRQAHEGVLEARRFWDAANLDWVSAWIAHPQSPCRKKVAFVSNRNNVASTMANDPEYFIGFRLAALRMYVASPPLAER